ncbi:cytochrome c nitrite reductase small subunit [bacterium]|nr:cytochrome c nitrite reductase small subunit [candidate division CSSED10-310 bacterium]
MVNQRTTPYERDHITRTGRGLSPRWLLPAGLSGVLLGLGLFTFNYAEGLSYFSSDPEACQNCHIMRAQFDSWQKAAHHGVAVCVDCHLPADFFGKYLAKADNGYHHSKGFTLQDFHEPIMIKEHNGRILQDNCLRCHVGMVEMLVSGATTDRDAVSCVHCHQSIGHGEPVGLGGADRGERGELARWKEPES